MCNGFSKYQDSLVFNNNGMTYVTSTIKLVITINYKIEARRLYNLQSTKLTFYTA